MAAFVSSHIPPEIDTYESLIVWATLALKFANPGINTYQGTDANGVVYSEISIAESFVDIQPGDIHVFACKYVFRCDRNWQSGSQKPWDCVIPLSSTAVSAAFRAA